MARANRETWAKRVERWKDSGLSAAQFAAEVGISPKSLSWWKWRLASKAVKRSPRPRKARSSTTAISPLTFVEMAAPVRADSIEISLPSGLCVRVPLDFDMVSLARLVGALEARR